MHSIINIAALSVHRWGMCSTDTSTSGRTPLNLANYTITTRVCPLDIGSYCGQPPATDQVPTAHYHHITTRVMISPV